jgi:exopolysaccharide production protein ExoY
MLKEQARAVEGIARATDLGLVSASFLTSGLVSARSENVHGPLAWLPGQGGMHVASSSDQYALLFTLSLLSWMAATQLRGTYLSVRAERSGSILWDQIVTLMLWALLVGCAGFFFKLQLISRSFLMAFFVVATCALSARQAIAQLAVRYMRTKGFNLRDVVIVGDRNRVVGFAELFGREAASGYRIVRQIVTDPDVPSNCDDIEFDEAFVLMGADAPNIDNLVMKFVRRGKRVHFVPGIFDARQFRQGLTEFAGIPLLTVGGYGLSLTHAAAKRAFDIAGSLILLVGSAPLFVVVALLVKLSSPGPSIFSQVRIGQGGREFRIYKFRTMHRDAEKILYSSPALYKQYLKNNYKLPKGEDPRVTPIGNILRSTSLDELPQLFNVLKGDMSLVGPRPVVPAEVRMYGDYGALFMSVKPGLTGNWQINGRSDVEDYSRRAALDLDYVRDQSLKNDVDILLRTIPAVVLRKGAH